MNTLLLFVVGAVAPLVLLCSVPFRRSAFACMGGSVLALGMAAFCGFGYLASFELPGALGLPWQIGYSVLGVGSLMAAYLGGKGALRHREGAPGAD